MAMTTGARKGELMNLRWCDVTIKTVQAQGETIVAVVGNYTSHLL
ncbi:MAG: hypothetical protein QX189_00990 [Methylococcales bacterium]